MSEKKKLVELNETRLTYMAGVLLKDVANALSRREFVFETADGPVTMTLPKEVDLEYQAKQKTKDGETKTSLEIEISWKS